jgi:sugar O-acyltransferase (sialic acid O-acetyltransferase NeuD family)
MKKLAYVGAGRLAEQFASFLDPGGRRRALYFGKPSEGRKGKVVLPFERYLEDEFADCEFYVALGYLNLALKRSVVRRLKARKRKMPALIHPSAYVHPSADIGLACAVYPRVVIGPNCAIKDGALLNSAVVLAHDDVIGEVTYLSPSVTASGFCRIGAECFVGTGTVFANDVTVGARCRIGIGSVITQSLRNDSHGIGNPFQRKRLDLT